MQANRSAGHAAGTLGNRQQGVNTVQGASGDRHADNREGTAHHHHAGKGGRQAGHSQDNRFFSEDRIAIIFCGSKKSLATGIPMMNVIFAGAPIGLLVIPIMVFHQLQLMVCSFLARKWAKDVGKGEQL